MEEKLKSLMEENQISFSQLANSLKISKQTLTKKMLGHLDFTFEEIMTLSNLLKIQDPSTFFYS